MYEEQASAIHLKENGVMVREYSLFSEISCKRERGYSKHNVVAVQALLILIRQVFQVLENRVLYLSMFSLMKMEDGLTYYWFQMRL